MKKLSILFLVLFLLSGCAAGKADTQIAATTLPVYEFTTRLCEGTGIGVTRLVTENVSCLHDYTLKVGQMRAIESAEIIVISGAGLEDFLEDALSGAEEIIDASDGLTLLEGEHIHNHGHDHGHVHGEDPHIWLSPENAKVMARNICAGLSAQYPQHTERFESNLAQLLSDLDALQKYGDETLKDLSCRKLITFHDGFRYVAESVDLHVLDAIEEESGSEASAAELIELIELVSGHHLPGIFTETNGSVSAARIVAAETGAKIFCLDMAMAGSSYFDAMYANIDTVKEALQ